MAFIQSEVEGQGWQLIRKGCGGKVDSRERLPIPSTNLAEGVMKGYNHCLKRNPVIVSKAVKGSFQSSQLY